MMMIMMMMDDWCCGGGGGGVGRSIVLRFLGRMNVCVHQSLSTVYFNELFMRVWMGYNH